MTVKATFQQIFRRENIKAVTIEGDAFHRFNRADMQAELTRRQAEGDMDFSNFPHEDNELSELERVFRDYGDFGTGRTRHYIYDATEAYAHGVPPGEFAALAPLENGTDLLFYKGLQGPVVNDQVNLPALADLKIGVVPVINLEWIQKVHRDRVALISLT